MPFVNRIGSGATRKFGFGAGMAPGAPTSVVGTFGDQQVSVAFSEPAQIGTGIPTYTATSSPGGFTASGASSPLVVTGLSNGTSYTFTVTATNNFGSTTSAPSSAVTPAVAPSTPGAPTPTRGDTQVSLTWTAPSNGGSAITDYLVQYSSDSGSTWTTFADGTSATTSATVTGLTNGTSYVFRIAAVNIAGTSSYSSASTAVTPAGVPVAPAAPTPTAGNASVSLSWTAPSANGSAITDYKIYYATSAGGTYTLFSDTVSTTTSVTVTGLTNGTAYFFKVAAVNAVGDSALSAASTSSTPAAPPFFPFFPFFPEFDPCAGRVCPSYSPTFPAGGGEWVGISWNEQPWAPHCINDGYPADPPYCCNYGSMTCGSGKSYWYEYQTADGCCSFNLYVYCACN
jgi:hypothetical protein